MIEPALSDDALLSDVEAARTQRQVLHLWWLGQSGFLIQHDDCHVLLDPYLSDSLTTKYAKTDKPHVRMSRRVVAPEKLWFVDVILVTHGHTDHLDAETIRSIREAGLSHRPYPNHVELIAPSAIKALVEERWGSTAVELVNDRDVLIRGDDRRRFIEPVAAAHETVEWDELGRSRYLGYVIRLGRFSLYHSGDTVLYDGLNERWCLQGVDIALLPINGRATERRVAGNLSGREAAQLAKDIGAKLVIPCHYDMFEFNTADPYEQFVPECERIGQPYRVLKLGERLSLPENLT